MADATAAKPPSPKPPSPPARSHSGSPAHALRTAAENTIEADDAADDAQLEAAAASDVDEGFESDSHSSASTSVSSSVRDYVFENSRRYHRFQEGRYLMPNDEPEQEREDMKHAMIVNLCEGKLHMAPLENPQTVLDIGTGTGIWVVDSRLSSAARSRSISADCRPGSCLEIQSETESKTDLRNSGRRVSRGRNHWHRPQPHTTDVDPAQRALPRRRRRGRLDLRAQLAGLCARPPCVYGHQELAAAD